MKHFGGVLIVVACLSALATCQLPIAAGQTTPKLPRVPGILATDATPIWTDTVEELWKALFNNDIEEVCNTPTSCPCQGPGFTRFGPAPEQCTPVPTFARCGGVARVWFRMVFHDCGTFDLSTRTGGCDGSLQFELDRSENSEGMDIAIDTYRNVTDIVMAKAEHAGGPRPSMADVIIAAGLLGLAKCRGPVIPFTPGRRDADVANRPGLLPDPSEPIGTLMAKMGRASLSPAESVALIGAGHTMSRLRGRLLDATPDRFDNRWFTELAARAGTKLPSDIQLLADDETLAAILLFAADEDEFFFQAEDAVIKMIHLIPIFRSPPPPPPPQAPAPICRRPWWCPWWFCHCR